jgi:hypothetical protein
MRLVDGDKGERHPLQQLPEGIGRRPFGGHVEQVERALPQSLDSLLARLAAVRGGERGGPDPEAVGGAYLVLHQRYQRRDHQSGARAGEGWDLVAKRFAGAGGHHRQRMPTGHDSFDHPLLYPPESGESERPIQDFDGVGHKACLADRQRRCRAGLACAAGSHRRPECASY